VHERGGLVGWKTMTHHLVETLKNGKWESGEVINGMGKKVGGDAAGMVK